MRIGVLVTSIDGSNQRGFYNSQEIGLAKALACFCDDIKVYKLVAREEKMETRLIEGTKNSYITFLPVKKIGTNGITDLKRIDSSLDVLIYFSDTQLDVVRVYKWACRNDITMYPYIGVVRSHSTNTIKKIIMERLFYRNVKIYRKCQCFAKTPDVCDELKQMGIMRVCVAPVGLDKSLLRENYKEESIEGLKEKYGYELSDKIILFVGRLTDEKRPLEMLDIFREVYRQDNCYKLLIVGKGEKKTEIEEIIHKWGMVQKVRLIEQMRNQDMWELYRISSVFVNLNKREIFGMAVMEAMYYGCKVVVWEAPGPNLIIDNGISGWLVGSKEKTIEKILDQNTDMALLAHKRIEGSFMWKETAKKIMRQINFHDSEA